MKDLRQFLFLLTALLSSSVIGQSTDVTINVDTKHQVGDQSVFDRQKYINIHACLTESDWTGEEDKLDYVLRDLDVYLGRDNGNMGWNMNQADEDPNKPGFVAESYMQSQSNYANKTIYGVNNSSRHQYEDKADIMYGGQENPFWPGKSTNPCCGKTGWEIGGAEASGDYMGRYFNDFFRNDGEASTQGPLRPRFMEIINEPLYGLVDEGSHDPIDVFRYHNDIAKAIRKHNTDVKIGGFTVAFPYFDEDNFDNWEERMKLFIDTCGTNMDYFSIHIYDFNKHHYNNGKAFHGPINYKGGRLEATMDMIEQYSYLTLGEVKPIIISEYGGRDHSIEWKTWSVQRDWNFMKSYSPLTMQFMKRPNTILKTIPFIMNKSEWGYNTSLDVPYAWRLMRKADEPTSYTGDWEFTELIKYYELWSDVNGTRVKIENDNPDILTDAYADGNTLYVLVNNLNFNTEDINLNLSSLNGNTIQEASVKHLSMGRQGQPVLDDLSFDTNSTFTMGTEATAIFKITFANDINVDKSSYEKKYYADSYLKMIYANQENKFSFKNVAANSATEAYVRVSFGRDHGKSKTPTVMFNGTELAVPTNYSGDDQNLRNQFFSMLEIPVPANLLKASNEVSVKFSDSFGHISTVTMRVFSTDNNTAIEDENEAIQGIILYPNPCDGRLFISSSETETIEAINIYTMKGETVYSETDNIGNSFDLGHLSKGLYLVSVQSQNGTSTQKLALK